MSWITEGLKAVAKEVMSERMSDEEFELCARTEGTWTAVATGEKAPTRLAIEARRARAAEKRLRMGEDFLLANLANAITSKAEMGDRLTRERDCAVARAKERGDRLVELENALAAERAEVIRLRLDVKAERARTEMVEQTRGGLRAALKGLSDERWWPDRQSHGPCWCAYNSADWADHAPRCRRAAEALGQGDGVEARWRCTACGATGQTRADLAQACSCRRSG